jgi:hypothetical protein
VKGDEMFESSKINSPASARMIPLQGIASEATLFVTKATSES